MEKLPQEIYCDESGFTGNNLLNRDQPIFTYASVATTGEEAENFVQKIITDYNVQGGELKGQRLIKYNKGRRAITEILKHFSENSLVSVFHKKYSLACKFFEYIFEPALAKKNSLFYNINFHKFISNIIFVHLSANAKYAEDIFEEFEKAMRSLDENHLTILTSSLALANIDPVMEQIRSFAFYNRESIKKELDTIKGIGAGTWVLDLTDTAVFHQLAEWGQRYAQLVVFCDASKPLDHQKEMFNVMINRKDKKYIELHGSSHPITFNMSKEIQVVSSTEHYGIQIADVVAGATAYIFLGNNDRYTDEWGEYLK